MSDTATLYWFFVYICGILSGTHLSMKGVPCPKDAASAVRER